MNDEAFTLYIAPPTKRQGRFRKGSSPWNKGKKWSDMFDEQTQTKLKQHLKDIARLGAAGKGHPHPKPVIQMDEYGERLHWYESSEAAARKLGLQGRNIRKVCDGERNFCGGYRWRWDERFL